MHDRKRKLGQARRFPRGQGKKAGFLSLAFAVGGVSIEFVHGLCDIRDRRERDDQAEKGNEAMKAPTGPIGKERACTIDQDCRHGEDQHLQRPVAIGSGDALGTIFVGRRNNRKCRKRHGEQQDEVRGEGPHAVLSLAYRRTFQPRRESVNCAPESEVQLSWLGLTRAQLTLDCVLRTSEVMLISTRVGEVLI